MQIWRQIVNRNALKLNNNTNCEMIPVAKCCSSVHHFTNTETNYVAVSREMWKMSNQGQIHDRVNSRTGVWNEQLSLKIQDGWSPYMHYNEFWITGYVNGLCSCCCCFRDISWQWCWCSRRQRCHRRRTEFYAYTVHHTLKQCWGERPIIFHYTMVTPYSRVQLLNATKIALCACVVNIE